MSDQPPRRDASVSDEPFSRPLPDGGLADAMPDWLRRPPTWRDATAGRTSLPPPDTSPIDPRTLIDVDDLPPWLQRLAAGPHERRPEPTVKPEHRAPKAAPIVDPHRVIRATTPKSETSYEVRPKVVDRHNPSAIEASGMAAPVTPEPRSTSQVAAHKDRRGTWLIIAWISLVLLAITGIVLFLFWL